jgi:hypothetical protein
VLHPVPVPPLQPSSSAPPHFRVLERPLSPSPSPDRPAYRPMEPLDPNDSPWSRRLVPCAVHGWACPNRVTLAQGASSSGVQGEEEGREEDEDNDCQISVVSSLVGPPAIRQTARISIGPRGRPHVPLAPQTATTLSSLPTPSLAAPGPPPMLPSSEASPLLSLCGNPLLRRFAHLATPSDKGRAPELWDSTAGPSR